MVSLTVALWALCADATKCSCRPASLATEELWEPASAQGRDQGGTSRPIGDGAHLLAPTASNWANGGRAGSRRSVAIRGAALLERQQRSAGARLVGRRPSRAKTCKSTCVSPPSRAARHAAPLTSNGTR